MKKENDIFQVCFKVKYDSGETVDKFVIENSSSEIPVPNITLFKSLIEKIESEEGGQVHKGQVISISLEKVNGLKVFDFSRKPNSPAKSKISSKNKEHRNEKMAKSVLSQQKSPKKNSDVQSKIQK